MTTQQEPPRIEERVARIEGAITDIPRQLDAQNRTVEGLRTEMRESIDAQRVETRESVESLRTEMNRQVDRLDGRMDRLEGKMDRLLVVTLTGVIAILAAVISVGVFL